MCHAVQHIGGEIEIGDGEVQLLNKAQFRKVTVWRELPASATLVSSLSSSLSFVHVARVKGRGGRGLVSCILTLLSHRSGHSSWSLLERVRVASKKLGELHVDAPSHHSGY